MGKVVITGKGRRWLAGGHPWVYADEVADATAQGGELAPIEDPSGQTVGWGLFSAHSKIAVRLVSRGSEQPNREFWRGRVQRAVDLRRELGLLDPEGACRLLAGDAEGLPGFVVDRYADVLVVQCGTQAAERMRDFVLELFDEVLPEKPRAIVERSDLAVRKLEGLEPRVLELRGSVGEETLVREPGMVYAVDVLAGHKTGHYLDQRENRMAAARTLARVERARVLDAFSYDGLFGLRAALAGASEVLCLDQNQAAGERLLRNAERNGVAGRMRFERANAMKALRDFEPGAFDLVVLDPPAFARNRGEVEGALRGYRELNLRGMLATRPGGRLVSASCSYAIKRDVFQDCLAKAARDAERDAWIEEWRGAAPDHPVHLHLPESGYLKCAILRLG